MKLSNLSTKKKTARRTDIKRTSQTKPNTHYFKLSYIGSHSHTTQQKLRNLTKRFRIDLDIELIYSSFKIKNIFNFKDTIPSLLKSCAIYEFSCAGCNFRYVLVRQLAISPHASKSAHILTKTHNLQTPPHFTTMQNQIPSFLFSHPRHR